MNEINEFTLLQRSLTRTEGFSLFVAVAQPTQRHKFATQLLDEKLSRPVISVPLQDNQPIVDQIYAKLENAPKDAVISLIGLDSFAENSSPAQVRRQLNWQRASFQHIKRPLLLWLTPALYKNLLQDTPDFIDWASGTFEFSQLEDELLIREQLKRTEEAIGAQNSLRGILPIEQLGSSLKILEEQKKELQKTLGESTQLRESTPDYPNFSTTQLATIAHQTAAKFWEQFPTPQQDILVATEKYLIYLMQRYRFLEFKGMGMSDRIALQLPLAEMYVPLKARIELPRGDTWSRELRIAGRQLSQAEQEEIGQRLSEPQPMLDLLAQHRGLIVLGDPGAGKTTLLKYLALVLAKGEGEKLDLRNRLPILLPLSAYANHLSREPQMPLTQFFATYYQSLGVHGALALLLSAVVRFGGALFLLDGLDEIQEATLRQEVVSRVNRFFTHQKEQGNQFVLSSRIVGYRQVRLPESELQECTLVDFDDEEIKLFIENWTVALERAALGENEVASQMAEREREALQHAVLHNPGVRQLAANPLLLTILALMKRQGVTLPERRVELYERYVEVLLKQWNLARGLGRSDHFSRDLDVVETVRVLAPLALWMHQISPGIGLVEQEKVEQKLIEIYEERGETEPVSTTKKLLADVREYASLLLERGAGMYGFIHLTFQEYLAAVAIAQAGQGQVVPIVAELGKHVGDASWHEVILLTIGYMGINQRLDKVAGDVLLALMAGEYGEPGQSVLLAGEAVVDSYPGGVTKECRDKVMAALLVSMGTQGKVPATRRAQAGRVLAKLGDPRQELLDVDKMGFCWVPPGEFMMGEGDGLVKKGIDYGYWMGKYPVTNAQFAQFVAEEGYLQGDFWAEAIKDRYWDEAGYKGNWDNQRRQAPHDFGERYKDDNQPVVGVSWYEGMAFCRWLTRRVLEDRGQTIGGNREMRLPTEMEWEKAARGGLWVPKAGLVKGVRELVVASQVEMVENRLPQRIFPWGDMGTGEDLNCEETGIGGTSALGCFPKNISPYGCVEMSGHVWEWLADKDARVNLKGGAWYWEKNRCSCRSGYGPSPDDWHNDYGFRVAFPVNSGF